MTAATLLADLRARGVSLAADGDRLTYAGPSSVLTATTLAELAASKAELLEILTAAASPTPTGPPNPIDQLDPFVRWRQDNAALLTAEDLAKGYDSGGFCGIHHRWLTYPEQQLGRCSTCLPTDPERARSADPRPNALAEPRPDHAVDPPSDDAIGWRIAAMRSQVPSRGVVPFIVARPDVEHGPNACLSCGDPLPPNHLYRCQACVVAVERVLNERLEGVDDVR